MIEQHQLPSDSPFQQTLFCVNVYLQDVLSRFMQIYGSILRRNSGISSASASVLPAQPNHTPASDDDMEHDEYPRLFDHAVTPPIWSVIRETQQATEQDNDVKQVNVWAGLRGSCCDEAT
ncbi:MAG: hypothetical protein ACRYF4_03005 [Janthinobacterium lividum]